MGESVTKGEILADNNFTKGGVLALGKNLTTAIMPLFGQVYEDGIVVSQSASEALSSGHLYDLSRKLPANSKPQLSTFSTYGKRFRPTGDICPVK